jgi:hypothetical protein
MRVTRKENSGRKSWETTDCRQGSGSHPL